MAALSPRTGPRPIPDIMRELKDATGVDAIKITEAANAVCEELGVDTSGTLKDKVHRAAAELDIPIDIPIEYGSMGGSSDVDGPALPLAVVVSVEATPVDNDGNGGASAAAAEQEAAPQQKAAGEVEFEARPKAEQEAAAQKEKAAADTWSLGLTPSTSLTFKWENEADVPKAVLRVSNSSSYFIYYRVQTTKTKRYWVRPGKGIVLPDGAVDIQLTMVPADASSLWAEELGRLRTNGECCPVCIVSPWVFPLLFVCLLTRLHRCSPVSLFLGSSPCPSCAFVPYPVADSDIYLNASRASDNSG